MVVLNMKKHHMITNVQRSLRHNSLISNDMIKRIDFNIEVNTAGIIQFITCDHDVMKYFVLENVGWIEEHDAALAYFDKAVGDYDRCLVSQTLSEYGIDERETKFMKLYTLYPIIPAFLISFVIAAYIGLTIPAFIMMFILVDMVIALILITYVFFYEQKGHVLL